MLGDKLKKLRERKGLNKKQMAQELGLQYMTYCRYENDEREPNNEILIEIANYFDVTIDYLIGNSLKLDIYPHEYENTEIRCPVCGCENVHFVRIANVEFESEKSNGGAIEFRCEDGHLFYYVFETLKGCSYIVNFGKDAVTTCQTSNLPYDSGISSLKEIELSELYNSLDNYGKDAVESILRIEYNRCNAGNQNTSHGTTEETAAQSAKLKMSRVYEAARSTDPNNAPHFAEYPEEELKKLDDDPDTDFDL